MLLVIPKKIGVGSYFLEPLATLILQAQQARCRNVNIRAESDFIDREVMQKHSFGHFHVSINPQTIQSQLSQQECPTADIRRPVLPL
jgi:hypothetical protein